MAEIKDLGKTSTGMQPNLEALLCYIFGVITGVIFYIIEKENKFVRFHAMQSIVVLGALFVASIIVSVIPFVGIVAGPIILIAEVILWVVLMVKSYQGELFKIPVAGDIAEKNS